jgi:hypothetical protein
MTDVVTGARAFAILLALGLASSAQAQEPAPATEHVTVTSDKTPPEKALRDFIGSYTAPSPTLAKVTRWHAGVCPGVTGLPASWNSSVAARMRAIASAAGAPVAKEGCRINIDIVFTKNPQVLLDGVRDTKPIFLGYHDVAQEKQLATVRHAVQAWYMTQTVDSRGGTYTDDKLYSDGTSFTGGLGNTFQFSNAHVENWNGSRLGDARRSELTHALIVVDLDKVNGIKLAALTDEVAMLALAQTAAFGVCQPVISIANLTAPCDAALKTEALSNSDQAYLHALYAIDPNASLIQQRGKLAYEMKKSLDGR